MFRLAPINARANLAVFLKSTSLEIARCVKSYWHSLLRLCYPHHCQGCQGLIDTHPSFCADCFSQLPLIYHHCRRCSIPLEAPGICLTCETHPPSYAAASALLSYDNISKVYIHRMKYHRDLSLIRLFAGMLYQQSSPLLPHIDLIIPTPLHPFRMLQRGYNQAYLIARHLSRLSGIRVQTGILIKSRHTSPQTRLTYKQRQHNLRQAFSVPHPKQSAIKGKRILLVDDVATSGATLSECTKTLLQAGAAQVVVATIARTAA